MGKASAYIYSLKGKLLHEQHDDSIIVKSDTSINIFTLPSNVTEEPTYFVKLVVINGSDNSVISRNWYWLSQKVDVLDWDKTNFYRTECSSYADLTSLQNLSPVHL